MPETKQPQDVLAIVKNDAIEDGIAEDIIEKLNNTRQLSVLSRHVINLTIGDVLHIYQHEYEIDPTNVREILIAMNAATMQGDNLLIGLEAQGFHDTNEALTYLESVKGKVGDSSQDSIRSTFPFSRPSDFGSYSFWFQAPFFVRNRIHSPHDEIDLKNMEEIAVTKGISLHDLYPKEAQ